MCNLKKAGIHIEINGSFLKTLRLQQHKTQKEVAEGICAISHLSKIENNIVTCSKETWDLLLQRLEYSVEEWREQVSYRHLLLQWYSSFYNGSVQECSHSLFIQLQEIRPYMTEEELYLFHLFSLRYFLLQEDMDNAKHHFALSEIVRKTIISPTSLYWEAKIKALYEYVANGDLAVARNWIRQATAYIALAEMDEYDAIETKFVYCSLFSRYDEGGDYDVYLHECTSYYATHSTYNYFIKCLMLRGISLTTANQYDEADAMYERALQYCHTSGEYEEYGQLLHNRGVVHLFQGKEQKGLEFAIEAFRRKAMSSSKLSSAFLLLYHYGKTEQWELAQQLLSEVMELWEQYPEIQTERLQKQIDFFHGLLNDDHNYAVFTTKVEKIGRFFEKIGNEELRFRYLMLAAETLRNKGQYKLATKLYRQIAIPLLVEKKIYY